MTDQFLDRIERGKVAPGDGEHTALGNPHADRTEHVGIGRDIGVRTPQVDQSAAIDRVHAWSRFGGDERGYDEIDQLARTVQPFLCLGVAIVEVHPNETGRPERAGCLVAGHGAGCLVGGLWLRS